MFASLARRLTFANLVSVLALFVALGGTGYAALTITGKNVINGSLTGADLKDNSVGSRDIKNGNLLAKDFKAGQLPVGRPGQQGPTGATGPAGPQGETGPKGVAGDVGTAVVNHGTFNGPPIDSTNASPGATVPLSNVNFTHYADQLQVLFMGLDVKPPATCDAGGGLVVELYGSGTFGSFHTGDAFVPYPGQSAISRQTLTFLLDVSSQADVTGGELHVWDTCGGANRWTVYTADGYMVSMGPH